MQKMFKKFVEEVRNLGLTDAQLRCDVRPNDEILDLMSRYPDYEVFVTRILSRTP